MSQTAADRAWNVLTFFFSLFSLFVKDWAERWPGAKWLWPRAWDLRRAKHETTGTSPDAGGHLKTEFASVQADIRRALDELGVFRSNFQHRLQDIQFRERRCARREERIVAIEIALEHREGRVLTELKGVVDTLKVREDQLARLLHGDILS